MKDIHTRTGLELQSMFTPAAEWGWNVDFDPDICIFSEQKLWVWGRRLQCQSLASAAWTHGPTLPCVNRPSWWWLWNGVGNDLLANLWPLDTNQSLFDCHSLHMYCCLPCRYYLPSFNGYVPPDDVTKSSQNCLNNITISSVNFSGLPGRQLWI